MRRESAAPMVAVIQDACLSGDFDIILQAVENSKVASRRATQRVIHNLVHAGALLEGGYWGEL